MLKHTTGRDAGGHFSLSALALRFYGLGCVAVGAGSLWLHFTIQPGTHGIPDWTRGWWLWVSLALLGLCVLLLLRWPVALFALLSTAFGIFYLVGSLFRVPFPAELINIFFATLAMLPAYLTYRAWRSLR